ncbi:MAG: hypothetical protein M3N32_00630 [Actinomycetota bacterium]|nr:hypothetical protein [Actinomycetota bacterium]
MTAVHCYVGASIVVAFLIIAVYGGVGRLFRRRGLGKPFWGLLYYGETVLVVQIGLGILLFLGGQRPTDTLHYVYGSLFPLIALVVGRLYALRREDYDYVPIALAAFVAFGLTTRAFMTGQGNGFGCP